MADLVSNASDMMLGASDTLLAKHIGDTLNRHYPGHLWAVQMEESTVHVYNLRLSGTWGFLLHKTKIDPNLRKVIKAGGELLERYQITRGRFNPDEINMLDRDWKGDFRVDVS